MADAATSRPRRSGSDGRWPELMPDEPEVHGLLATMLLHDARRDARFHDGELVLLADQDSALWDADRIAEGNAALDRALALRGRGSYVIQAAIASLHVDEPRDWAQIAALYGELARLTGSPVVELNRAVAVAEAEGPEAGLRIADRLPLERYRYLHATRGELLRRLGRPGEARDAYARALELGPGRGRAPAAGAPPGGAGVRIRAGRTPTGHAQLRADRRRTLARRGSRPGPRPGSTPTRASGCSACAAQGADRDAAVARLHELLLGAARFEVAPAPARRCPTCAATSCPTSRWRPPTTRS